MSTSRKSTYSRKEVLSWCLFDFANSSYSAVIAAVVFPVYYTKVIVGNAEGLGDLWWGRAISISMLIVAVSSPFLGGISDRSGGRKKFLAAYTLISVSAIALLSLIQPGMVLAGFLLIVFANMGMEGGLVFYNAWLPEIAPETHRGRISAWGFALGYTGSLISLLISLPLARVGLYGGIWLMVASFFLLFSLPLFAFAPGGPARSMSVRDAAVSGMRSTWITLRSLLGNRQERRFLAAYFLYQDGVNTVIVFSSIFASTTLGFATTELIILYLVVQASAMTGSVLLAKPIDIWGARNVVFLSLGLWIAVSVTAYFVYSKPVFWAVAVVAGLGLGSVQAASRALYSSFIPEGEEAGRFGIYSLVGKTSSVLGPMVFGTVSYVTGSQRPAILSVSMFFIAGAALLAGVRDRLTVESPIG